MKTFISFATLRGVNGPAPLMLCLEGITSSVGRTGIIYMPTSKRGLVFFFFISFVGKIENEKSVNVQ